MGGRHRCRALLRREKSRCNAAPESVGGSWSRLSDERPRPSVVHRCRLAKGGQNYVSGAARWNISTTAPRKSSTSIEIPAFRFEHPVTECYTGKSIWCQGDESMYAAVAKLRQPASRISYAPPRHRSTPERRRTRCCSSCQSRHDHSIVICPQATISARSTFPYTKVTQIPPFYAHCWAAESPRAYPP